MKYVEVSATSGNQQQSFGAEFHMYHLFHFQPNNYFFREVLDGCKPGGEKLDIRSGSLSYGQPGDRQTA
jgi:hypothetical protein